jgi:NDP-sugar pyrophosphorylase family protein
MRVIILAAGQSRRFQEAGYQIPKPFIKVDWNGTVAMMIEHVLYTIPLEYEDVDIALPPGWSKLCSDELFWSKGRGIKFHIIEHTIGPADTVYQVLTHFEVSESCLILDTDMLNSSNDLMKLTRLSHCGVLVRRSANPSYSYVDKLGAFQHIKEKERIAEYAVQGAYFIPQSAMAEFLIQLRITITKEKEPFMSHVFDRLSLEKYAVPTTYIPVDWGTPQDVELSGAHIVSSK